MLRVMGVEVTSDGFVGVSACVGDFGEFVDATEVNCEIFGMAHGNIFFAAFLHPVFMSHLHGTSPPPQNKKQICVPLSHPV